MQTIEGEACGSGVEAHAARRAGRANTWDWRFISCDTVTVLARVGSGKKKMSFLDVFEGLSAVLTDRNNSYLASRARDAGIHVRRLQTVEVSKSEQGCRIVFVHFGRCGCQTLSICIVYYQLGFNTYCFANFF